MAIQLINEEYCPYTNESRKEFIADTVDDVGSLPECCAGSTALVPDAGTVYMVNASGEWAEFGGAV